MGRVRKNPWLRYHEAERDKAFAEADACNEAMTRGQWVWRFTDEEEWRPVPGTYKTEAGALRALERKGIRPEEVNIDEL